MKMISTTEQDDLEKRVRYPQPYSIKTPQYLCDNPALEHHYKQKEHHRLKYNARWNKSKQSKRSYDARG